MAKRIQLTSPKYNKTTAAKSGAASSGGGAGGSVLRSASGSGSGSGSPAGGSYSASTDYHKQAADAAARGDWSAVERALTARQAKIDQQGGNDRGTSNAQILSQLRSQYGTSYERLPSGTRDRVSLAAGEKLSFTSSAGQNGNLYKDKGWQDGVDYLGEAAQHARNGDLDAAYDALMRRGFKMSGTGSAGGGTSQDQAYALIHQLYSQSPGAQQTYQNKLAANQRALQDHQTQFGLEARPELAYRQFKSADNKYWIIYDGNGVPVAAKPVSHRLGEGKTGYSQEEIDLMSQYYGGSGDRAELERQLHNLAVVRTGTGRLVDAEGNWASGSEMPVGNARDWNGLPEGNVNQDRAVLQGILDRINGGEVSRRPEEVPTLPAGPSGAGALTEWNPAGASGGAGGGIPGGSYGGGYGGEDLSGLLRQMYAQNLEAQLAALKAAYQQNAADFQAQDGRIAAGYRDRRNQAAAQNDLQRMYLAEMGAMQGLNTGASGQMALAQSAAYQGGLAELWAAESQDRSANDLEMRKLAAEYQGDLASAAAKSNSALAGALYEEYARQIQAAETARQAAQAQANWQAQFDYQRQRDDWERQKWQAEWEYGQQADRQSTAYKMASAILENGVMPDAGTLLAAGISQRDAEAYVSAAQAQTAARAAAQKNSGSSGSGKPKLTYSQALSAINNGQITDAVIRAYDYYMGSGAYARLFGGSGGLAEPGLSANGGGLGIRAPGSSAAVDALWQRGS